MTARARTEPKLQQVVPTGLVLALAGLVTWLSFTGEPAQAFLFPRLISLAFVLFAGWSFARAVLGVARSGAGLDRKLLGNIAPGLAIMIVYIFWAAKTLGFYVASTLAVFGIFALYDPAPHGTPKSWLKRVIVTIGFMAVIHVLFTIVLKVQIPRGLFR